MTPRLDWRRPAAELLAEWRAQGIPTGRTKLQRRFYKRLWSAVQRETNPRFRRRRCADNRRYYRKPGMRERYRAHLRNWRRKHPGYHAEYMAAYRVETGQIQPRKCFECRKVRGLRKVKRLVEVDGKWVPRKVWWCGRC